MSRTGQQNRELVLSKFGGLYTESDPRDLPPGASPQCWDNDFIVGGVGTRQGLSNPITTFSPPLGAESVQYLKTADVLGPRKLTLMQEAGGGLWQENILTSPGTFSRFYSPILNNAQATSETVNQREYIPLSDLIVGQDQPRQYDGLNLDRISQVGPGVGPSVPVVAVTLYPILSITEIWPAISIDSISWGASINLHNAQPASTNLYFLSAVGSTSFTTNLNIGDIVYVSGNGNLSGQNPNGTYIVTSIGSFTDVDGTRQYFGVTASVANSDFARGGAGGTYQKTEALIQLSVPIPPQDAVVGNTISISGATVPAWDGTWTITGTPTEGQLSISQTSLTSNVATYTYSPLSGVAPGWQPNTVYDMGSQIVVTGSRVWQVTTPGTSGGSMPTFAASPQTDGGVTWTEQPVATTMTVIVFNTSNGNGIFNVQNAVITSATSNSFTVAITSPNIAAAAEVGSAVSGSGKALIINPGLTTLGTGNPGKNPIFGNATAGGNVLPTEQLVAPGQRYCVLMFLTRNGYITPASPPVQFFTTGQSNQLTFNNLPIGPPDVIARIVAITLANAGIGGPYFWIPKDVILQGTAATLGITTTISKTIIYDNVSTSIGPITLNDAVLAEGINITIEGNNLLQQRELGECVKVVQFAGRAFYLGERVKNDELINMTFDGGSVNALPAGWTITAALVPYVSLIPSQVFGQSLYIHNVSGATINPTGTALASIASLYQTAFQNAFETPIIEANLAYSLRVTCASPSGSAQGFLVVELYSASLAQSWQVQVPLATMATTLTEFSVPFNNPLWQPVPKDLQLRVYGLNLANGADIVVDRMEVFPNEEPVYINQVAASYAENTEAIDGVTGAIDVSILSSSPLTNEFTFLNKLFLTTESKTFSPIQNAFEPGAPSGNAWQVDEISNAAGSLGPLAVDVGEEYVLTASEKGAYVFDGGNHVKFSQEIQQIWDSIYPPSKKTVWIRNDIRQQRILIGVPLPTPNQFLPNASPNPAPSSPNVILMCSVLGLPTGAAIADGAPVSQSMFGGNLIFHDMRRKWTIWQIPAATASYIDRPDGSEELWLGQVGAISKLDPNADSDNGVPIVDRYVTFGFSDAVDNERLQIGSSRRLFNYGLINIEGAGKVSFTLLPETLATPYPQVQANFTLQNPALDDVNCPFNETGMRAFFRIDGDGQLHTKWNLKRIDLSVIPDPRMLVSGR